jgi:hypothetical protein
MALIDHIADVAFASAYPIDKIVYESNLQTSVLPAGVASSPAPYDTTVAHPAGPDTVVSGMFTIDGTNFYPFGATIPGTVISGNQEFLQAVAYNDDTSVYVQFIQAFETQGTVRWYFYMESLA